MGVEAAVRPADQHLNGLIPWGVMSAGLVWLLGAGVKTGLGGMIGAASGAYTVSRDALDDRPSASPPAGMIEALRRRHDTELGGEKFVDGLKKAGFGEGQARKARSEIKSRVDRLRDDPSSLPEVARDVANNPEVRRAAGQAAEWARPEVRPLAGSDNGHTARSSPKILVIALASSRW